jgi:hypothetical protein
VSASTDARQLDRIELAALGYLLAPMLFFLWGWWRWPVALAFTGLLAVSIHAVVTHSWRGERPLGAALWLVLGAVTLLWVGSSGLLGGLPLSVDWSLRLIVLRDLTIGAWPVSYGEMAGGEAVLRFSMGYYLIPAGLGAWLGGVETARLLQGLWTTLGVLLFLALIVQSWPQRRPAVLAGLLALLLLFSGMDILGYLLEMGNSPAPGQHIEWWAPWLQYSSQTTLLHWVPNHALPAWLGAALVWRHRDSGLALAPAALFLGAAALWSPLACVGLVPLLALATWRGQTLRHWLRELLRPAPLAVLPLLALLAIFVSFGIVKEVLPIERREFVDVRTFTANWYQLVCFQLLEWALLAAALLVAGPRRRGWVFWAACGMLLLLPLVRFGGSNDLLMRAGIAPLTLLILCTAQVMSERELPARWRAAVLLMLAIGLVTPGQELWRQTQPGTRWPDQGLSMASYQGTAWHYVGRLVPGLLAKTLREPQPVPTSPGAP